MNKSYFNYFLVAVVLSCSSISSVYSSVDKEQNSSLSDIDQVRTVIVNEIDEAAVKFASDSNVSEKKKKQCLKQLKKILSVKEKSSNSDKNAETSVR